ncbi:MAG: uracil-DNA glycosylase, partial [Acidisphaera sp.]|nr:uracil-DNA glycosylase [Acidisphaera sp.]
MEANSERQAALAALRLQIGWGADEALGAAAVDRTREPAPTPASTQPLAAPLPSERQTSTAGPRPPLAERAEAVAAAAQSRDELYAAIQGFEGCALSATATRLVFSDGNPDAGLMLVG